MHSRYYNRNTVNLEGPQLSWEMSSLEPSRGEAEDERRICFFRSPGQQGSFASLQDDSLITSQAMRKAKELLRNESGVLYLTKSSTRSPTPTIASASSPRLILSDASREIFLPYQESTDAFVVHPPIAGARRRLCPYAVRRRTAGPVPGAAPAPVYFVLPGLYAARCREPPNTEYSFTGSPSKTVSTASG